MRAIVFFCLFGAFTQNLGAQLPTCISGGHVVYYKVSATSTSTMKIYNFNIAQPVVLGVNPVVNTITLPQFSMGLTVSPNLNSSGPSPTFYTIVNSQYNYYNGTTWINTGHTSGPGAAVNPGAGGGYIFNLDAINGTVWRYNGTGNAIQILSVTSLDKVADIAVTCSGEFYLMSNGATPQTLKKYDANGTLLATYTVSGAPVISGGGGLAIFGNTMYYTDGTNIIKGVISGTAVTCSIIGTASVPAVEDYANCADNPYIAQASLDTGYYCGTGPGVMVGAIGTPPFSWKVISGTATIIPIGDSALVRPATDARIVLTSGSSNAACGGNTDTFSVLNADARIDAGQGDTLFVCNGAPKPDTLKAAITKSNANVTYNIAWSPASSILSGGNTLSPIVNPVSQIRYYMMVSTLPGQGGCTWRDSVDISVKDATINAIFDYKTSLGCAEDTLLFTGQVSPVSGGIGYYWDFDDNGQSDNIKNPVHIYHQGVHTIHLYANNNRCTDTATATVDLNHPLKADFNFNDALICEGDTVSLDASASVIACKSATQRYYWRVGDQADSIYNPRFVITGKSNVILLAVTDTLNCTDTLVREFTNILPYPSVEAGPTDTLVCDGVELHLPLGISSYIEEYLWEDGTTEPAHTVNRSGTYIVQASNRCGTTADTMHVEYRNCTIFFPSAFTPNGDGLNDLARLAGNTFGITACDISIYNRFGERVFHTTNKDFGWDGIYHNTPQLVGTYYYYITFVLLDERYEMKGDIILIR